MIVLGIDPGLNGAFCLLDPGINDIRLLPMPIVKTQSSRNGKSRTDRKIDLHALAAWLKSASPHISFAVLEQVSARPGQGVSSMFKFGRVLGNLEMAVVMAGIPIHYITPQVWRRETATPKGKDGSLVQARNLFPGHAIEFGKRADEGKAEAALIAWAGAKLYVPEYAKRLAEQLEPAKSKMLSEPEIEVDPFS